VVIGEWRFKLLSVFSSCNVLVNTKHVGCNEIEKLEELYVVDYIFVHMFMLICMCMCSGMIITVIH
jgi:hypothetical protein